MNNTDRALLGAGLLIPVWLLLGVSLTALGYPGYSHLDQAMSQLGAKGAPTHAYSAWVNNFPLGLLFALFALGVARRFAGSRLALFSAALILLHGLASFATGLFACDEGCVPAQPSISQHIHNAAGLVMFLSLTLASALGCWLGKRLLCSSVFAGFSALCLVLAIATVAMMGKAMADGHGFGLYQRLNYGVSVVWVAALAWAALRSHQTQPAAVLQRHL
ncbi:DUF998 domain-containing protein [Pseudomonas sp. BCRC 81390]|uniref:DUF998 domain-containing protein n=1 Tax=Pseudomonas sp. BCRC 81390 TaxID=3054778 RepID=UPI002591FB84|nr:DUF998 domain-containing protein [Pseudomonas sp. BCRC 81390]MDM3884756.1 DUF998 domain-containing protein [Pseudomonas sp. BCRC 81390]